MKEKAPKKQGLESNKYSFSFKDKEYSYVIQEPTFDQLAAAMSEATKTNKLNILAGGKVIWELCCIEFDEIIEKNPKILISVCTDLFDKYVMPLDIEIKKN